MEWDNCTAMQETPAFSGLPAQASRELTAGAIAWLSVFLFYLIGLAPGLSISDSGEMISCAITLSNTHMPGYPLLMLLGKIFSLVPAGSPGFRMNLLSAAASAASAAVLWIITSRVSRASGMGTLASASAGAAAALACMLSPKTWQYSGMAEKYALFMALYALAVLPILDYANRPNDRSRLAAAFFSGLAVSQHYMGLFLVPVLAWMHLHKSGESRVAGGRNVLLAVMLFILPVTGRALFPPIRAEANPPINWGVPNRVSRMWSYATMGPYRDWFHNATAVGNITAGGLGNSWRLVKAESGPILLFSALGLIILFACSATRPAGILLAALAVSAVAVYAPVRQGHAVHMDLTLGWIAAACGGVGVGWLVSQKKAAILLVAFLAAFQFTRGRTTGMRGQSYAAWDHLKNMTAQLKGPGIVAGYSDVWLFPLWYGIEVEGLCPGIKVVTRRYLDIGAPEHKLLEKITDVPLAGIEACQNDVPVMWEIARGAPRHALWIEPMGMPMPSVGAAWDGIMVRIGRASERFGVMEKPSVFWSRLRTHRLMEPRTDYEIGILAGNGRALAAQALLLRDEGRAGESRSLVKLGSRLTPGLPELSELTTTYPKFRDAAQNAAKGLVYSGIEDFNLNRFRRAAEAWNTALRIDPHQYQALYELGRLAELEERYGDAFRLYSFLNKLTPWVPEVAEARSRAGKAISLQASLPKLVRAATPGDPKAWCDLGNACFELNRLSSAELFYRRALRADPKYPRGWRNLGSVLATRGEHGRAAKAFRQALEYDPANGEVMAYLAMELVEIGDRRGARAWAKKAGALAPRDPTVQSLIRETGK